MKYLIYLLSALLSFHTLAQGLLPEVHLPTTGDLHILSPEPIQYVDISAKNIQGDLALPNLLRLRFKDSLYNDAIITIAGEKFIAQFHLLPVSSTENQLTEIRQADTRPLDISGVSLSHSQLKNLAYRLFCSKPGKTGLAKAFGLQARINHIATASDYIFLDLSYKNNTNLGYDIDSFRFKIDDKTVTKAANAQSLDIKPEFTLFSTTSFNKTYRNIFVLKKMSYPGNKVLHIELSEKQVSGRVITLTVPYQELLSADTINL